MLQCPKCKEALIKSDTMYRCANHHTFDLAKRGYCNLLLGNRKVTGDDKGMVLARTAFLQKGYYQPLQERMSSIIQQYALCNLIDAGCGQGYYTNKIKADAKQMEIYGFDLSKAAVDEACKQKAGVHYFVASVFDLPIRDNAADGILSIFAPIHIEENFRVLKDQGYFFKVEPGPKHLEDLKKVLYDEIYDNEAYAKAYPKFTLLHEELLDYDIHLDCQEDIQSLFQMTPYYWKTSKTAAEKLYQLQALDTRIQFHIEIYQKQI